MASANSPGNGEMFNLRWTSHPLNLIRVFGEHQSQESLVDVTLSCEKQFIKAHRLVLSSCSGYFQKIFEDHTAPNFVILLNNIKYQFLHLVVQFMYLGEVKVAECDLQDFLALGRILEVKGLCNVDLPPQGPPPLTTPIPPPLTTPIPPTRRVPTAIPEAAPPPPAPPVVPFRDEGSSTARDAGPQQKKIKLKSPSKLLQPRATQDDQVFSVIRTFKRKVAKPDPAREAAPSEGRTTPVNETVTAALPEHSSTSPSSRALQPPNAFMIFANQWRKKLAVEFPNESNKDISVRLGNMWKSLSPETKDQFYEDAKKAEEEHRVKHPNSTPRYTFGRVESRTIRPGQSILKMRSILKPQENIEIHDSSGDESNTHSSARNGRAEDSGGSQKHRPSKTA